MRIYLDTAPAIYAVERVPRYAAAVDQRLSDPQAVNVTSSLTRMECRVKPMRDGDGELLKDYEDFFQGVIAELIVLSHEVLDRATEIRARYGFRTPDAIHLAAAVVNGCDVFLTNDRQLQQFTEIRVEIVIP